MNALRPYAAGQLRRTGTSHAPVDETLCRAEVRGGDSRWPTYSQCKRAPKGEVEYDDGVARPTCGFHLSVVRRAEEADAAYRAARKQQEADDVASVQLRAALRALGVEARAVWRTRGGVDPVMVEVDGRHLLELLRG